MNPKGVVDEVLVELDERSGGEIGQCQVRSAVGLIEDSRLVWCRAGTSLRRVSESDVGLNLGFRFPSTVQDR